LGAKCLRFAATRQEIKSTCGQRPAAATFGGRLLAAADEVIE
jgi:hypothetical protein